MTRASSSSYIIENIRVYITYIAVTRRRRGNQLPSNAAITELFIELFVPSSLAALLAVEVTKPEGCMKFYR